MCELNLRCIELFCVMYWLWEVDLLWNGRNDDVVLDFVGCVLIGWFGGYVCGLYFILNGGLCDDVWCYVCSWWKLNGMCYCWLFGWCVDVVVWWVVMGCCVFVVWFCCGVLVGVCVMVLCVCLLLYWIVCVCCVVYFLDGDIVVWIWCLLYIVIGFWIFVVFGFVLCDLYYLICVVVFVECVCVVWWLVD